MNLKASDNKISEEPLNEKVFEFYKCIVDLQERILSQFIQSINFKLPPYIKIDVNEHIRQIKTKKDELKKLRLIDDSYDSFSIINYTVKDMSAYCHGCKLNPDPGKKSFFSSNGCYYHFECMKKLFEMWYDKNEIFYPDIEENEIDCVTCKSKISVASFLKDEENKKYLKVFKVNVQGKAKCCLCQNEYLIDKNFRIDPDCLHCPTCMGRIYYLGSCPCCQASRDMVLNDNRYMLECQFCKKATILANFDLVIVITQFFRNFFPFLNWKKIYLNLNFLSF